MYIHTITIVITITIIIIIMKLIVTITITTTYSYHSCILYMYKLYIIGAATERRGAKTAVSGWAGRAAPYCS